MSRDVPPPPLTTNARRRQLAAVTLVAAAATSLAVLVGPVGIGVPAGAVVWLRVGRVALAFVVGAALSATGTALQALLRSSLADPYVMGVSGGAALGAAAATALSALSSSATWAAFGVPMGGIVGAGLASALLLAFIARGHGDAGERTVLVGVVLNAFSWAFVAVVRALLPPSATQGLAVWLIGAIAFPDGSALVLAAALTGSGLLLLIRHAGALRLMRLGDDEAARLGVDVSRVRVAVVVACTVLVGAAVATSGVIGFVGLLVPHALRRLGCRDERALVPVSALGGGAVLVVVDAVARGAFAVVGSELPVGALTALLGAPGLAFLLVREGRR